MSEQSNVTLTDGAAVKVKTLLDQEGRDDLNLRIDFAKGDGLVPVIVQDAASARVLMLGYMNSSAAAETLRRGRVVFRDEKTTLRRMKSAFTKRRKRCWRPRRRWGAWRCSIGSTPRSNWASRWSMSP